MQEHELDNLVMDAEARAETPDLVGRVLLALLEEVNEPTPLPAGRCECGQPIGH